MSKIAPFYKCMDGINNGYNYIGIKFLCYTKKVRKKGVGIRVRIYVSIQKK